MFSERRYLTSEPLFILIDQLDDLSNVFNIIFKLFTGSFSVIAFGAFSFLFGSVDLSSEVVSSDFESFYDLLKSK